MLRQVSNLIGAATRRLRQRSMALEASREAQRLIERHQERAYMARRGREPPAAASTAIGRRISGGA